MPRLIVSSVLFLCVLSVMLHNFPSFFYFRLLIAFHSHISSSLILFCLWLSLIRLLSISLSFDYIYFYFAFTLRLFNFYFTCIIFSQLQFSLHSQNSSLILLSPVYFFSFWDSGVFSFFSFYLMFQRTPFICHPFPILFSPSYNCLPFLYFFLQFVLSRVFLLSWLSWRRRVRAGNTRIRYIRTKRERGVADCVVGRVRACVREVEVRQVWIRVCEWWGEGGS